MKYLNKFHKESTERKMKRLERLKKQPVSYESALQQANEMHKRIKNMETQTKPDWITDEQWKAVPSIGWWENNRKGAEHIAQSKPPTKEEVSAQFSRLRNEKNWKQGE
jgi:hypothetical protein